MRSKIIKILKIIGIIILILLLIATGIYIYYVKWDKWRIEAYKDYAIGMEELRENMTYCEGDGEVMFTVKYPEGLQRVGNLAVTTYDDSATLIIWLQENGSYKYGLQLLEEDTLFLIPVEDGEVEEQYQYLVDEYMDTILKLEEKAESKWGIDVDIFNDSGAE